MELSKTQHINSHRLSTTMHGSGNEYIVIFCHGFRSSSIGPNRFFVEVSRCLASHGISSLRFDQYGSGNSEGNFIDSSFDDWVKTIEQLVITYQDKGFRICLFGQSMGGSAVIVAAAKNEKVSAVVCWVPDPSIEVFLWPKSGFIEEAGQIVRAEFWLEAHKAEIKHKIGEVTAPMYIVQCSNDEYVSLENQKAVTDNATSGHLVEMFEGYNHSTWTSDQATVIIKQSVDFIVKSFAKLPT